MQNMIFAEKSAGAFQGQDIQGFLDNANNVVIPFGRSAYFAQLVSGHGDIETLLAESDFILQSGQGFSQIIGERGIGAQQEERQPGSGFWAYARQALEGIDKILDRFWEKHGSGMRG